MKLKHLYSLKNLSVSEIINLLSIAKNIKHNPLHYSVPGKKSLAIYFEKPSTRTRLSAHVSCNKLGLNSISLDPRALQLGKESVKDTALVMSRLVDGLFARASDDFLLEFIKHSSIPVINALSESYHPTQILADLLTMQENGLEPKNVVTWIGDGNNILNSMLVTYPRMGIQLKIACPPGYEPSKQAIEIASNSICPPIFTTPKDACRNSNYIMTDVFTSMGQEADKAKRLLDFKDFKVNKTLFRNAAPNCKFMHCLPRTKHEVSDEVFYGSNSIVFEQAENRRHTIQAVFYHYLKQ
eukprot:NODE_1094_length_1293_cov_0.386097.p1 type:complete len:297 gc:universal NODE_1094_length_1293_cov_0.386097:1076-186(-)